MRRSTHLIKSDDPTNKPTYRPDGMGQRFGGGAFGGSSFGSFNFGGSGFNFGGSGFNFGQNFNFNQGGAFNFNQGGGAFNFNQGGFFNEGNFFNQGSFGSGQSFGFEQQRQQFGFDPNGLFNQSGQFSYNPNFRVENLNQSAFGQNSPFGAGAPLASSDTPNQGDVPDFDNWKEFVAFLFRNGPAWVKAFKDGRISAKGGAARDSPSGNRREVIQRYMAEKSKQMNRGGLSQGGVGGFLRSTTGMLLIGGVLVGGIALAAATSGGQRRRYYRR